MDKHFTIIGAGIAGLTAAIALRKIGIEPCLYESAPANRTEGAGIVLAANAIKGLSNLGLAKEILSQAKFLNGLSILDDAGKPITRTDTTYISKKYGIDNVTIHRGKLMEILESKLPRESIIHNKRIVAIERHGNALQLIFQDGSYSKTDYLLLADGIHSPVRQQLIKDSAPRYAGYTCWRAVVRLPNHNFNEAQEYWGTAGRFGLVPLPDDRIYWYACINAPKNDKAMQGMTPAKLMENFKSFPAEVIKILNLSIGTNLLWNDILDIEPLRNYAHGNVVLLGDAAHATTPNMGQGACQGIEDAVVLAEELQAHDNPTEAFVAYEQRRLKKTHYVIKQSRMIGQVAQWENPFLCAIRNNIFRMLPASLNEKKLEKLYRVDFKEIAQTAIHEDF